ncbi:MAG TPA: glycosyl hydrolase, partial [Verrucomicrobiae bacterium]|nr:glycosyl hydrolase [Verrucomicrobiae bacterium]
MMKSNPFLLPVLASILSALTGSAIPSDPLESGFLNPPDSARPQTWWHWMNGNITRAGITADLEAMKQIGLGGATIVNVDCGIPRGPVAFMSPEWRADFKFAVQEANRLGLKLCVENCAGWSSSGGPWNSVTNAMQRLTSSETRIQGPVVFDAVLPPPPMTLGFYRDIAVLAFKAPVAADNVSDTAVPAGKLKIKRAVYEAKNGGGSTNVTAKISALLERGQKSVVVGNDEMGGDPAFGQAKQLRVEFTLAGKPETITAEEGSTLIFPADARQLAAVRLLAKSPVDDTFVRPPPSVDFATNAIP